MPDRRSPADAYDPRPRLKRGGKFDWLYQRWVDAGLFRRSVSALGFDVDLTRGCNENRQHDERAALVCLLTAAGVFQGRYTAVGDAAGGYIFLPPWRSFAAWAREELDRQRARVPGLEVWIDGRCHGVDEGLPHGDGA